MDAPFDTPALSAPPRPRPRLRALLGYVVAIVAVAGAGLLRVVVDPVLGGRMPFSSYFLAVGIATWLGGEGPGVLATVASMAVVYGLVPWPGPAVPEPPSLPGALLFSGGSLFVVALNAALHRARRRAIEEARTARRGREALERSRRRYEALASASGTVVWTTTPDGRFAEPQPSWERFTGQGWPAHRDFGWMAAVHPDDVERARAEVAAALAVPAPASLEWRLRHHASGGWRWAAVRAVPVFDLDGSVREWVGVTVDVHEQRELEAAARETETLLRTVADHTAACIVVKDRDGRYVFVNAVWRRLFDPAGHRMGEFTDADLFPPDVAAALRENDRRALESGHSIECEERVPLPGGDATYVSLKVPLRDDDGQIFAVCGISTDITERKRVETELRRLALVVEASREFVAMAGLDERLLFVNPAGRALVGLGASDPVAGYSVQDVVAPEHHAMVRDVVRPAVLRDGRWSGDWNFRDVRTGERIAVHSEVFRVDDPATGEPLNFATVTRDVRGERAEEARRREDQARLAAAFEALGAANRAKDEFLAMVSHELRNPLHAMTGWLEIARTRGARDAALMARALITIDRNLRRQAQVVDELLDVSRMVTGRLEVRLSPTDLNHLVEAASESARPSAEAKGLQLLLSPLPAPVWVQADAGRLGQVFGNLLANAIEFTPPGGTVSVAVERTGDGCEVRVADSGEGIPAEFLPFVFDPFRQADASITRSHEGLGLGLAIVRHLVERHGGSVHASSGGPGRGAVFRVCLPCTAAPVAAITPGDGGGSAVARALRVLLVEDDADTRDVMKLLLEGVGWRVTAADSARTALALWQPGQFDVVLSDVGMSGEDGYALVRALRLREADTGVRTPAIALTGFAGSHDRERALAAGFDAHVAKPVDPDVLLETVYGLTGAGDPRAAGATPGAS